MKAAFITEQGEPEVIQFADLPDPVPGDGQLLVRMRAVAVNPIDTYIRGGKVAMPVEFPYVVGSDFAGEVIDTGPNCTRFRKGDRVWGSNQGFFGRPGAFSELLAVDEEWASETPAGVSDQLAAAGALTGITAHLGLFRHGHLQEDEIVFVNGGTGGVGSAVIQLAKAGGARVIATVGNDEKKAICESLGTDLVINYRDTDADDRIRSFCEDHNPENPGIDIWYETQREPTLERTIGLMAKRGRIILMAGREAVPSFPLGQFYPRNLKMIGFAMFNATPDEQRLCAESIMGLAECGEWNPLIGREMSLSETSEAHRLQEANTIGKQGDLIGKIVLTP